MLDTPVAALDVREQHVVLHDGRTLPYGVLLIATGAEPVRLAIPGAAPAQVLALRTFDDSRAIVARAGCAPGGRHRRELHRSRGGGVAARAGLEVHVIAPGYRPLERVLGADFGGMSRRSMNGTA